MVTKILHVLCEGQTELLFVNKVLGPYLKSLGIFVAVETTLLVTNKKKATEGGMISYEQVKRDLSILLKQWQDSDSKKHYFTTMFDYYALPQDFPGFAIPDSVHDSNSCVENIECAMRKCLDDSRIIPYIELHEYEALVFCGLDYLRDDYPDADIDALKKVLDDYNGMPEAINHGRTTAPSKRIISVIEKKYNGKQIYHYKKPASGSSVAAKVGMQALMEMCPHFAAWVRRLTQL